MKKPLSPFVVTGSGHHPQLRERVATASRARTVDRMIIRSTVRVNAFALTTASPSGELSTQATLPHYGISITWLTIPGTGPAGPAAAVVPALASIFDSWVTSVECVTTRPSWYVRAFRPVILS